MEILRSDVTKHVRETRTRATATVGSSRETKKPRNLHIVVMRLWKQFGNSLENR